MYTGCNIDEQLAVKMIQLMLDAAGEQSRCRQMLKLATAVQELDLYLLGTLNFTENIRHRQAALRINLGTFAIRNDRIDKLNQPIIVLTIHHDHAQTLSNLWCCNTNSIVFIHRLRHIIQQFLKLLINSLHRHAYLFKNGITGFLNIQ